MASILNFPYCMCSLQVDIWQKKVELFKAVLLSILFIFVSMSVLNLLSLLNSFECRDQEMTDYLAV